MYYLQKGTTYTQPSEIDGERDGTSLASALTANVTGEAKRGRSRSLRGNTPTQPGRHAQQDQSQMSRSTRLERILPISWASEIGRQVWNVLPANGSPNGLPGPTRGTAPRRAHRHRAVTAAPADPAADAAATTPSQNTRADGPVRRATRSETSWLVRARRGPEAPAARPAPREAGPTPAAALLAQGNRRCVSCGELGGRAAVSAASGAFRSALGVWISGDPRSGAGVPNGA